MICACGRAICKETEVVADCVNLTLERNTDNDLLVVITNAEGEAYDIGLDSVSFVAYESVGSIIFSQTNMPGGHYDAPKGQSLFTISKTDIDDEAPAGKTTFWTYEVRRIQPGGQENLHIRGTLRIKG